MMDEGKDVEVYKIYKDSSKIGDKKITDRMKVYDKYKKELQDAYKEVEDARKARADYKSKHEKEFDNNYDAWEPPKPSKEYLKIYNDNTDADYKLWKLSVKVTNEIMNKSKDDYNYNFDNKSKKGKEWLDTFETIYKR